MKEIINNDKFIFLAGDDKFYAKSKADGDLKEIGPMFQVVANIKFVNSTDRGIRIIYQGKQYDIRSETADLSVELSKTIDRRVDPLINDFISAVLPSAKTVVVSDYVGWFNDKYLIPIIPDDGIEWNNFQYKSYFKTRNVKEQLFFMRDALLEGKTLGLLYALSVSSIFQDTPPMVVYIEGNNSRLKSKAMLLASKVFIDQKQQFVASDITSLSPLKNIAVTVGLFGEEVKKENVHDVFLDNIIFTPSKTIFSALTNTMEGVIFPEDITDIPETQLNEALNYAGCAKEFINYYIKTYKKVEFSVDNDILKRTHIDKGHILYPLFKSCMFLSYFYGIVFVNVLNTLFEMKDKDIRNGNRVINFAMEKNQ